MTDINEKLSEYLSQAETDTVTGTRISEVLRILSDKQIPVPITSNIGVTKNEILIPELMKLKGRKKDTNLSQKTAGDYFSAFKIFNEWLIGQQKGELQMSYEEATEKNEIEYPIEREEAQQSTPGETDEVANVPVSTTKRGRTKKAETEKGNREQISLMVESEVYGKLKEIAKYKRMTISDILSIAMKNIVDKNYEKVQRIQQFIDSENIEI